MIIDIAEEKLLVISDLHIGNPYFARKQILRNFLEEAGNAGYSVCINGDGLDVAQTSFRQLARDIPDVFMQFKHLRKQGMNVYYIIGNHDIILEHVLQDWDFLVLTPFLNLSSGDQRIRIEHGHLYDPAFAGNPSLYMAMTRLAGYVIDAWPATYDLWTRWERVRYQALPGERRLTGEPMQVAEAASTILRRGFDAVIFGHTHHPGVVEMKNGGRYFNTGSWLISPTFVRIDQGRISLEEWRQGSMI